MGRQGIEEYVTVGVEQTGVDVDIAGTQELATVTAVVGTVRDEAGKLGPAVATLIVLQLVVVVTQTVEADFVASGELAGVLLSAVVFVEASVVMLTSEPGCATGVVGAAANPMVVVVFDASSALELLAVETADMMLASSGTGGMVVFVDRATLGFVVIALTVLALDAEEDQVELDVVVPFKTPLICKALVVLEDVVALEAEVVLTHLTLCQLPLVSVYW